MAVALVAACDAVLELREHIYKTIERKTLNEWIYKS